MVRQGIRRTAVVAGAIGALLVSGVGVATSIKVAGPRADGTGVTSYGWELAPAGRQVGLGDRPYGAALSPDAHTLLVANYGAEDLNELMVVDVPSGTVVQTIAYHRPDSLFLGVAFSPDGHRAYVSAADNAKVRVYAVDGQQFTEQTSLMLAGVFPAGLAVSPDGSTLYVADLEGDKAVLVDTATGAIRGVVPAGHDPFTVQLAGGKAYVSAWGANTVTVFDPTTGVPGAAINVGTHPNAMAASGTTLYVANAESDSVSVIDTGIDAVVGTIDLSPYPNAPPGSAPNALTVSPDGSTLYVANGENNDVAVVDTASRSVRGLIPTAWFPSGVFTSPAGDQLYVVNAKGLGAGPNPHEADGDPDQYSGSMSKGQLSIIDTPDADQLATYTSRVIANNEFATAGAVLGGGDQHVVPTHVGDASPIKHVIYIIKENRTYDQVLGDLGRGNGNPGLTLFGEDVTPNQHELARRFVTLDNFYDAGEVSIDGHLWSGGATANSFA